MEAIISEKEPLIKEGRASKRKVGGSKKAKGKAKHGAISDPEDLTYSGSEIKTELDSDVDFSISNEEVC